MTGHIEDALAYGHTLTGLPYSTAGGRLDPKQSGYTDCSGFIYACLTRGAGLASFPTVSADQARFCRDKGTLIPIRQALETRGALLFSGPNQAYDGYGPTGHVAFSLGDGRTLEATPPRVGVYSATRSRFNISNAALVPGVEYLALPLPPQWSEEEPMAWSFIPACAKNDWQNVTVNQTHVIARGGLKLIENGTNRESFDYLGVQVLDLPKNPAVKTVGGFEHDPNVAVVITEDGGVFHYHVRTA